MIWRGSFLNGVHVRFLIEHTLCLAPLTRDNRDRLIVRQPVSARKIGSCRPRRLSPGPKLMLPLNCPICLDRLHNSQCPPRSNAAGTRYLEGWFGRGLLTRPSSATDGLPVPDRRRVTRRPTVGRMAGSGNPRRTKQIRNESSLGQREVKTNFAACHPTACTCRRSQATLDISRCSSESRPHQAIHWERQPWQRLVKAK